MSMTENQTIKILKEEKSWESDDRKIDAFIMAIKALEKQIPKKPIDKLMYLECPSCGDVGIEDCGYCPVCGQKLDWGE